MQEYTVVICIAVLSVTVFPEVVPPKKTICTSPNVLFVGLSLELNRPLYIFIKTSQPFFKIGIIKTSTILIDVH